ncbi:MAG: ATP-dependent helicase [Planctomycetota bacterium]
MASFRHEQLAKSEHLVPAAKLLDIAEQVTGVVRKSRPEADVLLEGAEAVYDGERNIIYYSNAIEPKLLNFYLAHEYAHHWLDENCASCSKQDLNVATPSEPEMSLVGDSDSYSPKERAEALANVFGREFLLPRRKVRELLAANETNAIQISDQLGIPEDLVMQQMADALLLPEEAEPEIEKLDRNPPDPSQLEAIKAPTGPRLVRAGPGSGKTRTLVGRISHLVSNGESPESILALTYSNMSANDLAFRIRGALGESATSVWTGTFHAFGLEILRKHGHLVGFEEDPKLLDRIDSLMQLEQLLPKLELNYYLDLHEPLRSIRSILAAIGRAKDELATPSDYHQRAQEMLDAAHDEKSTEMAEKSLEVARVYDIFEQHKRENGLVDFSDLISRTVELLRDFPQVRDSIRKQKTHILVDEYQDMNRASAMMLKELVTPGNGPWVVGDVRQSIYRFRGASPINMSLFAQDFPGAETTDLSVNYRSGGKIVRAFETFGKQMATATFATDKASTAHRGEDSGEIQYKIAASPDVEARGIADMILSKVRDGDSFRNHTILARSHTTLTRIVKQLEQANVPCLYFGDFFQRPEVCDLLSLLSVVSEYRGVGLFRAAQLPQYRIPHQDVMTMFAWRRKAETSMLDAITRLDEVEALSDKGRLAFKKLAEDLGDVPWPMTAHSFLLQFLFKSSSHLANLLEDATVTGQQKRLAVFQLILFAFNFKRSPEGNPRRAFLNYIRRLEGIDEAKDLRQLPAAAKEIDAVRLMTVHASKGLEFPSVYLAALTSRHFPAQKRYNPCPLPSGIIAPDPLMSREAEEESLFFVAMSRAKDSLCFSRGRYYGKGAWKDVKPSGMLGKISAHLPCSVDGPSEWTEEVEHFVDYPKLDGLPSSDNRDHQEIETYVECPRKFYYKYVLNLGGKTDPSAFLKFQSAIQSTIGWMRETNDADERRAGVEDRFSEDWETYGPKDSAFESTYRMAAKKMVKNLVEVLEGVNLDVERTAYLGATETPVTCRADNIVETANGILIQRLKTSKLAKNEAEKARYVLLQQAVMQDFPDKVVSFEHVSLLTGEKRPASIKPQKLIEKIDGISGFVEGIEQGSYEPKQNNYCPSCPYYFICPTSGPEKLVALS